MTGTPRQLKCCPCSEGFQSPCARQVVSATPRQLESLVRLSEALARMRLSPTVEASDVAEALRLMRVRALPLSGARRRAATSPLACPAPSPPVMCMHSPGVLLPHEQRVCQPTALACPGGAGWLRAAAR
jgi:hypothetical protein